MADSDSSSADGLLDSIPDEVAGKLVKKAGAAELTNFQDDLRRLVEQFVQRNAIFTAKVQSKNRITIPGPEAEKLGLEKGDLVQVGITTVESQIDDEEAD